MGFEDRPAIGRITVTSPVVLKPFEALNGGKAYADRLKPFNFLLTCHVGAFGHPAGVDPECLHLIASFQPDARRWLALDWVDQYSGQTYRVTTTGAHGLDGVARVKTYGEVIQD